jgi:hypothetical protein
VLHLGDLAGTNLADMVVNATLDLLDLAGNAPVSNLFNKN